ATASRRWSMPGSGRFARLHRGFRGCRGRRGTRRYSRRAMKLLFVLDQWPELSETFVVNELEALRRQGHEVRVQAARIAPHPNPEAPADVEVEVLGGAGWRDLAWLCARRPAACARDLAGRRRW